jgi:hypothetical protein
VTIGSLTRLNRALDRAASAGAVRRGLPIWLTEFGVQSSPDRIAGVSLAKQVEFRSIAERMAYGNSRVRAFSQYLLTDDDPIEGVSARQRYGNFETGLKFSTGLAKPALEGFRLPLAALRSGSRVSLWGLVRPAGRVTTAELLVQDRGSRTFKRLRTVRTNSRGYFTLRTPYRKAAYRLRGGPRARPVPAYRASRPPRLAGRWRRQLWFLRKASPPHDARPDDVRRSPSAVAKPVAPRPPLARDGGRLPEGLHDPKLRPPTPLAAARSSGSAVTHDPQRSGFDRLALLARLHGPSGEDQRVLVVGHEPDFSQVVHDLTGARIDMKKGGVAGVRIDGSRGRADRPAAPARARPDRRLAAARARCSAVAAVSSGSYTGETGGA